MINKYELLGWIGSTCSIIKSYPQMFSVIKKKNTSGINVLSSWIWLIGLISAFIYSVDIKSNPMLFNCIANTIPCLVLIYYNYYPGGEND